MVITYIHPIMNDERIEDIIGFHVEVTRASVGDKSILWYWACADVNDISFGSVIKGFLNYDDAEKFIGEFMKEHNYIPFGSKSY